MNAEVARRVPILGRTTYLTATRSAQWPRGVYDKVRKYAESWATRVSARGKKAGGTSPLPVGDKLAALIGRAARQRLAAPERHTTQAVITSCFDFSGPRNKVVLVDLEFPSILYFYQSSRRAGARIEIVRNTQTVSTSRRRNCSPRLTNARLLVHFDGAIPQRATIPGRARHH